MVADPMMGRQINGYEIIELLGQGGMGNVYLAMNPKTKQRVAIKLLKAELSEQSEAVQRFFQEARAVNEIRHAHIVEFFASGTTEHGEKFIIMEYLEGELLSSTIKHEGPFPSIRVCQVGQQICSALASAHRRGIIHRDLKPDNIYLISKDNDDDYVKVLDFGIAKLQYAEGEDKLHTLTGSVLGTPLCMSPEQALGRQIDERSDIYSFGVILYMMATKRAPLYDSNPIVLANLHVTAPIPRPRERNPNVDPALEAVIMCCLEKEREARYSSMEEVAFALGAIEVGPNQYINPQLTTHPVPILIVADTPDPIHAVKKPKTVLVGTLGVGVLMVLSLLLLVFSSGGAKQAATQLPHSPQTTLTKPASSLPAPSSQPASAPASQTAPATIPQPNPPKGGKKKSEEPPKKLKVGGGTLNPF